MTEFAQVLEVKERVKARLLAIPGVHAVGIGNKWVKDEPTPEPAIMVLTVRKKAISEVPPAEVIPAEIEGVKTDVYECGVPAPQDDTTKYRPLQAGIQLEGGLPLGEAGTLGCFARTNEATPRVVAITNQHVVASVANGTPTQLVVTPAAGPPTTLTISGANTPGSMIVAGVSVQPTGDPNTQNIEVFYVTDTVDDHIIAATEVADLITAKASPGLTATASLGVITLNPDPGFDLVRFFGLAVGPHPVDTAAGVRATIVADPVTHDQQTITLAGTAASDCFASVVVNFGGQTPTQGFLLMIKAGDSAATIATALAAALNQSQNVPGITATVADEVVTAKGPQEMEFDVHSSQRVGQPRAAFCSACSTCCDTGIGSVIDARIQYDIALIQLDPGMQYKATIPDIGPITGTHPIQANETGTLHVFTRGRTTNHKSEGILVATNLDGHVHGGSPPVFHRHYNNAVSIRGTAGHFSGDGDSGAAVVVISNDPNPPHAERHDVAAILFSGPNPGDTDPGSLSFATPIDLVTSNMNLTLVTATSDTDVQTVPGAAPAPAPIAHMAARLQEMEREIMAAPEGAEIAEAVRRNAEEAYRLVNTNRRVATVWHRNGGPQILQGLIDMSQSPDKHLPEQLAGQPLSTRLERIRAAFERHASTGFAEDLRRFGPRLIEMCGLSYRRTLDVLQQGTAS